jgi:hypothetical protein
MTEKTLKDQVAERVDFILKSDLSPYEKKIALFKLIEAIDVGTLPSTRIKRMNYLLQGHLYNELAKECMEEYKKTTIKSFSKTE